MACPLGALVNCWMDWGGIDASLAPDDKVLEAGFAGADASRPPADPGAIAAWENRHGFRLPAGLRAWMLLSNGLYRGGPLVHPISAIGPMVIFGRMTDLLIQPESWFELGNPSVETVCVDLAYRWPGGGHPIFVSGDEEAGTSPRIIARSFEEWFLELLRRGGREYWLEPGSADLGDPWAAHRRFTPQPELPGRLRRFAPIVRSLVSARVDEREIAARTGLDHEDLEAIIRHVQHVPPDFAPS
jgi:hypothetical protein